MAGLTPTPFNSGQSDREQGIGKDGSRWIRGAAIEFAWGWLRFQPQSELSRWYQRRFGQRQQAPAQDRDRGPGPQAAGGAVALPRDRRDSGGRPPQDGPPAAIGGNRTDPSWILVRAARDSCQVPERPRPLEGAARPEGFTNAHSVHRLRCPMHRHRHG